MSCLNNVLFGRGICELRVLFRDGTCEFGLTERTGAMGDTRNP